MQSSTPSGVIHAVPRLAQRSFGPLRRVMFFGKNMSRSRCTGGLVDALRSNGLEVKWQNMATLRRWLGKGQAMRHLARSFHSYRPDLIFVFCRDLPLPLLTEFSETTPAVLWVEEPLDDMDHGMVEYMRRADLVCMSNPGHRAWLAEQGVPQTAFLMSGFSPRFHSPVTNLEPVRDVVFVGGPGREGKRARFLAEVSRHFKTEIFGVGLDWERWVRTYPHLRIRKPIDNRGFSRVCATSRIVLGLNQVNKDPLYFSNRTFLALACRAFHLTHYVPGLETVFENDRHLSWYQDTDECLKKIEHYLNADDERQRIAAEGYRLVMDQHQYHHRVGRILSILKEPELADRERPYLLKQVGAAAMR